MHESNFTPTRHPTVELRTQFVRRWHIIAMAREQTVADHSFGVILIARALAQVLYADNPKSIEWWLDLYAAATQHDIHEAVMGDLPTPAKDLIGRSTVVQAEVRADATWGSMLNHVDPSVLTLVRLSDLIEAARWVSIWGQGVRAQEVAIICRDQAETHMHGYCKRFQISNASAHAAHRLMFEIINQQGHQYDEAEDDHN